MKKLFIAFVGLLVIGATTSTSHAAAPDLLYGETHDYSVVFRGNTESIIYARIVLSNNQDTPIQEYKFEIPRLSVSEIAGYQVELSPYCIQDDYGALAIGEGATKCLKYKSPDYNDNYSYTDDAKFNKFKLENDGNTYRVKLPKPVEPNAQTAIVLSYIGKGYVDERLGLYQYNFESIKVPNRIKSVKTSVNVDSDFVLEGQRSSVNYEQDPLPNELMQGADLQFSDNAALGRVAQTIGTGGAITKEANNLAAGESFSVKGKYAASAWRINLSKIIMSVLVLVVIAGFLIFLARRQKTPKQPEALNWINNSPLQEQNTNPTAERSTTLMNSLFIGIGFGSASLVAIATYLLSSFIKSVNNSSYNNPDPVQIIMVIVLAVIFYLLVVLGPAIWLAVSRKNWKVLVYVIFWTFAWLIIFTAIYQWGLKDLMNTGPQPNDEPDEVDFGGFYRQ